MMPSFYGYGLTILAIVVGIISLSFVLHEFAHKILAQKYWLWSEFRLDPFGTLISLSTALMPFKIVAPGSVVIMGSRITKKNMGKIALVGPLTNVLLVIFFISLSNISYFFQFAALLNADLAVFNLIPVSVLDGRKVYSWNKKIWVTVFGSALLLWILVRNFF
jgi:Zn-dependent protease